MKAFKLKKRNERHPVFIAGPPITSFRKPNFPRKMFLNIHPPSIYNSKFIFEIVKNEKQVPIFEKALSLDLNKKDVSAMLDFATGNILSGFEKLDGIVAMPESLKKTKQS